MKKIVLFLACVFPASSYALETDPWFGNENEFESNFSYFHQSYDCVDTKTGTVSRKSNDSFAKLALGLASERNYHGEFECVFADTKEREFGLESFSLLGRYLLFNDVIGDPFSLTLGVSTTFLPSATLRDPSSLRHSHLEGELHLSIGKEQERAWSWNSRYWTMLAFGSGNKGSPWLRGFFAWEKNIHESQYLRLFAEGRCGFGSRSLERVTNFPGYRSLAYETFDFGVKYHYVFDYWGTFGLEYMRRTYAKFTPKGLNRITVSYELPFSL